MKYEKVTIAITLATIIGLGLIVGLASAPRNDPISQILEILLGIDTKVNDIQTDLGKTTQMLGSYDGSFVSQALGGGTIEESEITSDKPAVFTVTLSVTGYPDPNDKVYVFYAPNKWSWVSMGDQTISGDGDVTFTMAGYGVVFTYYDGTSVNLEVRYCIVVQGEKGTEVKIGEWT